MSKVSLQGIPTNDGSQWRFTLEDNWHEYSAKLKCHPHMSNAEPISKMVWPYFDALEFPEQEDQAPVQRPLVFHTVGKTAWKATIAAALGEDVVTNVLPIQEPDSQPDSHPDSHPDQGSVPDGSPMDSLWMCQKPC